jgi:hypothetical protein
VLRPNARDPLLLFRPPNKREIALNAKRIVQVDSKTALTIRKVGEWPLLALSGGLHVAGYALFART